MRKFIHTPVDYHFKNRTNPRTKTCFNLIASRNYASIPTYRIIERIKKQLLSRVALTASPNSFTLVNVTNLMSGISYGFAKEPVNILQYDSNLAFTFALTPDADLSYTGEPAFITRVSHEITLWGYSGAREYCTISIDVSDLLTSGMTIKDYEYLYLVIGSVTKNFAIFRSVEDHSVAMDRNRVTSFYTMYFNLDLASLFYNVPYKYWVYNKAVWESCPELLHPSSINAYSALYYAVFLSTKTLTAKYTANLESTKHMFNELYKHYLASQGMLISNQLGESKLKSEDDFITSLIYPSAVYCVMSILNASGTAGAGYRDWKPKSRISNFYEWLESLSIKVQEDIHMHPDIMFLTQMPTLCKDAMLNRLSTFRKASIILIGQSQHETFTQH